MTRNRIHRHAWLIRVRGGVLQLTLGISLIIAVLCGAIILLVYYARLQQLQYTTRETMMDNCQSGIAYLLANRNSFSFFSPSVIDLYGHEQDSVVLERRPWGVMELVTARASRGTRHQWMRTALVSGTADGQRGVAIHVPDNMAAIALAGHARIVGDAWLPEKGLTTGYIAGQHFLGKKLLEGERHKSGAQMPGFNSDLMDRILPVMARDQDSYQIQFTPYDQLPKRGAFGQTTYCGWSEGTLNLMDTLRGNLMVYSSRKVMVEASAYLEDVIIMAPDIEVSEGFTGSVQLLATRQIVVRKKAQLLYPSALVLLKSNQDSLIVVESEASVAGQVTIAGGPQGEDSGASFQLRPDARLHGFAYINGAADIQGTIWGHLTARRLQVMQGSSTPYINAILDGVIDGTRLSPHMPGSLLWGRNHQLKIVKWLD